MTAPVSRLISVVLIVAIALVSADALCASVCAWNLQGDSAPSVDGAQHSCHDQGPSSATAVRSADATCTRPHLADAPARLTSLTEIPSGTQVAGVAPAVPRNATARPRTLAFESGRRFAHSNAPPPLRI